MSAGSKNKLKSLAALMEIDFVFLEECLQCGAVRLQGSGRRGLVLDPSQLARIRRLQRICRSLEVDALAGSMIVDLLERVEEMQRDLEHWRSLAEVHAADKR